MHFIDSLDIHTSMNPTFNGSSAVQHFDCSNAIEICDRVIFDSYMRLSHIG